MMAALEKNPYVLETRNEIVADDIRWLGFALK